MRDDDVMALLHHRTARLADGDPVAEPLVATSTFRLGDQPPPDAIYGRYATPNVEAAERRLAHLEGAPCILSNWHVLHGANGAVGDATVQPGPFDDNNVAGNFCGNLLRSHLGAAGDCALSRIRTREHERSIFELDAAPSRMVGSNWTTVW